MPAMIIINATTPLGPNYTPNNGCLVSSVNPDRRTRIFCWAIPTLLAGSSGRNNIVGNTLNIHPIAVLRVLTLVVLDR